MTNLYLYRKISITPTQYPNPYIFNLEKSLSQTFNIVNKKNNELGILDLFRYLFKADIFYFNWIEILPQNRFGKMQVLVFLVFLFLAKCFGKKIVWTLHNKYSHDNDKNSWTDIMYKVMIKYSNLILTHSQVGVDFIKEKYSRHANKVKYIIHPILNLLPILPYKEKKYDFLIWGTIQPYKGITEFLKYVSESGDLQAFKILIVGKCNNPEYKTLLNRYLSENIVYRDEQYEIDEIYEFANDSKFILFTYKLTSILSSGSLMDSIRMRSVIIGPNDGAFKDLNNYSFVHNYKNFDELVDIHKNYENVNITELEDFYEDNTWEKFGNRLNSILTQTLV